MPRKRRDIPRFDPLQALNDDCEQHIKKDHEREQEKARKAREQADINAAWGQAIAEMDFTSLKKLGEVLVRANYRIWIDYLRVSCPRILFVQAREGDDPQGLLAANKSRIQAIRLLVAACGDSHLNLWHEVERFSQFEHASFLRAAAARSLRDCAEEFDDWQRQPTSAPTPWIIPAELAKSTKGTRGFSNTGIGRQIESGNLVVVGEHRLNDQSVLYRFRHRVPATHAVMLRAVIEFLKNRDKLVSSKPWISQLWDPI